MRNNQASAIATKYADEDARHATYDWRQESTIGGGSVFGDNREKGTKTTTCVGSAPSDGRADPIDDVVFRDESAFRNGGEFKVAFRKPTLRQPFCGMKTRTEEVVCPHMYACVASDLFVREAGYEIDDR